MDRAPQIPIRTSTEIDEIARTGSIVWSAIDAGLGTITPGVTGRKIHDAVADRLRDLGGASAMLGFAEPGGEPFPAHCAVSVGAIATHGVPDDRPLRTGEIVSVDLAATAGGWAADACRSAVVPGMGADADAPRLVGAARSVLRAGLDAIGPGAPWSRVAGAMRAAADGAGVRLVGGIAGHGIGRAMHEPPIAWIAGDGEDFVLESGMVLTVEPVVTAGSVRLRHCADGWGMAVRNGAQAACEERTVAVVGGGVRVLTGQS